MQLCESPSHLTGGLRAQAEGNAKPRPRGPHKAPSDTATPGHESALPSVVRTLRKLLGGPGDPCSPCVGEHAAPTMVLLPPLAQGGASGLSPALSGHETQREDSPCRPAAVRVPLCAHALCATTSFSRGCSDGRMRPPRPEATRRGLTPHPPPQAELVPTPLRTQSPSLLPPSRLPSRGRLASRSEARCLSHIVAS